MDWTLNEWFWRSTIFAIAVGAISSIIGLWVTYLVIKAAIRDGIKESGLVETWTRTVERERKTPHNSGLPDFGAER